MPLPRFHTVALIPHADAGTAPGVGLEVCVSPAPGRCAPTLRCPPRGLPPAWGGPAPGGALQLRYRLAADLARLRLPPAAAPRRADGLWRHTCFEAFVAVAGEAGYREFNFSPAGEWAAYAFSAYREGMMPAPGGAPHFVVRREAGLLELEAEIPADALPHHAPGARLRLALSAVIEDERGALSYWALCHPPGRPDFHHGNAFALEIPAPRGPTADAPPRG